jgi:hypothetical protein
MRDPKKKIMRPSDILVLWSLKTYYTTLFVPEGGVDLLERADLPGR